MGSLIQTHTSQHNFKNFSEVAADAFGTHLIQESLTIPTSSTQHVLTPANNELTVWQFNPCQKEVPF
jgi:hypothetical protein